MKRVSALARSKALGADARPLAIAQTSSGAATTPRMLAAKTESASTVKTWSMKVPASPSLLSFTSASIGTKACWKAPSAKRRRSMFGSLKAT